MKGTGLDWKQIVDFFEHVHKLKETPRTGWKLAGIEYPEQIASHMYGVALLSFLLSRGMRVDTEKMLKMALVHDLGEALAGDLTPRDKEYKRESQIVEDKLGEMVAEFPAEVRDEIVSLFRELSGKRTAEARIVEMADDLDRALTASHYERSGKDLGEFFEFDTSHFTESGMKIIKHLKTMRK